MAARAMAWANKADGSISLYMTSDGLTASMPLNADQAKVLISDLTRAIDELPRTVNAADLGLEAA